MPANFISQRYDAIIIGARCAGAATAMLLARQGARVLLVDRDPDIKDTLSTHALMRPAVSLLDEWGLLDSVSSDNTPAIKNTHFHYGDEHIDVVVKPMGNARGLYAPRRWLLDRILRNAAISGGAEFRPAISLSGLLHDASGRVIGAGLRRADGSIDQVFAAIVIGADGRRSAVAKAVNAREIMSSSDRSATVYTYVDGLPNKGYRWYFGDRVAAGLIPTSNGAHCFFTSCSPDAFGNWFKSDAFAGATKILATWEPEIAADLHSRGPVERIRRYPGAPGHLRDCAGPGWALVGDAGHFKDPATAHGITDAFLDADRLSRALFNAQGDASNYQIERDRHAPDLFNISQKIASLDWDFDVLKALHIDLNACMKAESQALTRRHLPLEIAA